MFSLLLEDGDIICFGLLRIVKSLVCVFIIGGELEG
jgi:hypothetical protein